MPFVTIHVTECECNVHNKRLIGARTQPINSAAEQSVRALASMPMSLAPNSVHSPQPRCEPAEARRAHRAQASLDRWWDTAMVAGCVGGAGSGGGARVGL